MIRSAFRKVTAAAVPESAGGAGLWEVVAAWTRAGLRVERSTCVWEVNLIGLRDRSPCRGRAVSRLPSGVWLA